MKGLIAIALCGALLVGCSTTPPPNTVSPEIEALESITIELDRLPELDLSAYKDVKFMVVEDSDGNKWVTLTFDDYKQLAALMREIRNYIDLQNEVMNQVDEHYQQALGGQKVD